MEGLTKIKIKVMNDEFEIEGTQEFVEKYLRKMPSLVTAFRAELNDKGTTTSKKTAPLPKTVKSVKPAKPVKPKTTRKTAEGNGEVPEDYKMYIKQFPKDLSQNDQVLVTGYYIQSAAEKDTFNSSEANKLLKGVGVKITNISSSLAQLMKTDKVKRTGKEGRLSFYRVSNSGEEHVKELQK